MCMHAFIHVYDGRVDGAHNHYWGMQCTRMCVPVCANARMHVHVRVHAHAGISMCGVHVCEWLHSV